MTPDEIRKSLFGETREVLEVGGGDNPIIRPNMDSRRLPTVDIVADLGAKWPAPDASVGGVYGQYIIEHISWRKVRHFVGEIYRVLRSGGKAVMVTANLKAQAEKLAAKDDYVDEDMSMIFGDQNYEGEEWRANSHACGFSPASAQKLFQEAGFSDVVVYEHPVCQTDMVIEAIKSIPSGSGGSIHVSAYNKDYFNGGVGGYGGYYGEGYRDFPSNWNIFKSVMDLKPKSVLEIGCARGYLVKRFEDAKVRSMGLDGSRHCYLTRVTDGILEWDITQIPWPVKDLAFDLCLSVSTLEHISESRIDAVIGEIRRTCLRSFHVVNFGDRDDGKDKTHILFRDQSWWKSRFGPGYHDIHSEQEYNKIVPGNIPAGQNEMKLNLASHITMFHYGWTNVDKDNLDEFATNNGYRFYRANLEAGLPWCFSRSVELIYASHILEHFTYKDGVAFLAECRRVLEPGGIIRIACPDAKKLFRACVEGRMGEYDEVNDGCASNETQVGKLSAVLNANHAVSYDEESLTRVILDAGFAKARRCNFRESSSEKMLRETLDMHPSLSLYMEASKD